MRVKSPLHVVVGLIALVAGQLSALSAQTAIPDEFQVRSAIIINLTRFIKFKPSRDVGHSPMLFCFLGYDQQSAGLESYLSAHSNDGRQIRVHKLGKSDRPEECQVLYVAPNEQRRFDQIADSLAEAGVLTISDDQTFTYGKGIVGLPVVGDRIEIRINLSRAEQSGIAISSRLLGVAKVTRKVTGR